MEDPLWTELLLAVSLIRYFFKKERCELFAHGSFLFFGIRLQRCMLFLLPRSFIHFEELIGQHQIQAHLPVA